MTPSPAESSKELYDRGREAMERRDFASAADFFRHSCELFPHSKTLELLGECLLELPGRTSEAVIALSASAGLGNKAARALFLLAKGLATLGREPEALEKLELAINAQPHFKAAIELRDRLQTVIRK